jgi:hypothetical protein
LNINVPWHNTSELKAATFAHANFTPKFMWEGIKPWSTIHHFFKGSSNPHANGSWWAYYLHEITHCLEWMLESGLPPNWGYCLSAASLYASRILMYTAPDENTFVEMMVDVTYE